MLHLLISFLQSNEHEEWPNSEFITKFNNVLDYYLRKIGMRYNNKIEIKSMDTHYQTFLCWLFYRKQFTILKTQKLVKMISEYWSIDLSNNS